jgi:rsbT co-antagonist protein RsbR
MLAPVRSWLGDIPLADPLQREQARLLQTFLLVLIAAAALGTLVTLTATSAIDRLVGVSTSLVLALLFIGALVVLRRGRFMLAVVLVIVSLIATAVVNMAPTGLEGSRAIFTLLALPIVLAGLLGERRILMLAFVLSIVAVVGLTVLEVTTPTLVGYSEQTYDPVLTCITFVVAAGVLAQLVSRFGQALQTALRGARSREQELDALRVSLEQQVTERTAALAQALADVETRAAEQARLLAEVEEQRITIRELSVPILPVNTTTLVMPLVGALDSARLGLAQTQALAALERTGARTLLIDVTGVPIVDTHVAQGLIAVVQAARLLGAEAVLIGIRPEVAQAVVALGLDLRMVRTARDLQSMLADR